MAREGQYSFYLPREVNTRFKKFTDKYTAVTTTQIITAALNFYLGYAERGVDGNLEPFTLENGIQTNAKGLEKRVQELEVTVYAALAKGPVEGKARPPTPRRASGA